MFTVTAPVSGTTVTQCTPCDAGYFVDVYVPLLCFGLHANMISLLERPPNNVVHAAKDSTLSRLEVLLVISVPVVWLWLMVSPCNYSHRRFFSGLGGPAASTDSINCTPDPSVATCTMNGNQCRTWNFLSFSLTWNTNHRNSIAMVSPGGPQGTTVTKKRSNKCFRKGYKRCPKLYGTGGTECVDVANDTDSCGGCMALASDVPSSLSNVNGVDCNTLPGINVAKCVRGQCKAGQLYVCLFRLTDVLTFLWRILPERIHCVWRWQLLREKQYTSSSSKT